MEYLGDDILKLILSLCESSILQELLLTSKKLYKIAESELWSKIVIVGEKIPLDKYLAFNASSKKPYWPISESSENEEIEEEFNNSNALIQKDALKINDLKEKYIIAKDIIKKCAKTIEDIKDFESVLVCGFTKDGDFYLASSEGEIKDNLWLIENVKMHLWNSMAGEE
jgi:hypothetical protein